MQKATTLERQEFARLRSGAVHSYLVRTLEQCRDVCATHTDMDAVKRVQGHAAAIKALLELIDPEGFSTNGKRG